MRLRFFFNVLDALAYASLWFWLFVLFAPHIFGSAPPSCEQTAAYDAAMGDNIARAFFAACVAGIVWALLKSNTVERRP